MATIQRRKAKDGKTSYRVLVRLRGAPTLSATFPTAAEARRWSSQQETRIREGKYFADAVAKDKTVADAIDRWTAEVAPELKDGAKTAALLVWWRDRIGHVLLSTLTPATIAATRDALVGETTYRGTVRSGATVNRYVAALSAALGRASKEWGWIHENPARRVSKKRESDGRVRFLSTSEQAALLEAVSRSSDWRLYPLVVLSITTGARQGELLNLTWADVDLERGLAIAQETKNGERRALHLVGKAREALAEVSRTRRRLDTKRVFAAPNGTGRFPQRQWEQARREAGLEDGFRWHDLRHTAASYLAMSGASLTEIAAVLGHKTLAMVKRYSHLSDSHVAGVVARAAEKFVDG